MDPEEPIPALDESDENPDLMVGEVVLDPLGLDPSTFQETDFADEVVKNGEEE